MKQRIQLLKKHPEFLKELSNIPMEKHIIATLLGVKPASNLSILDMYDFFVIKLLKQYKTTLNKLGLRLIKWHETAYVLYNRNKCEKTLKSLKINKNVEDFILHQKGHEMGYLYGYHPEDVRQYINKCKIIDENMGESEDILKHKKIAQKILNNKGRCWITENKKRQNKILAKWEMTYKQFKKVLHTCKIEPNVLPLNDIMRKRTKEQYYRQKEIIKRKISDMKAKFKSKTLLMPCRDKHHHIQLIPMPKEFIVLV